MRDSRIIPRRAFLKSAVAIGGTAALGACLDRELVDLPQGPSSLGTYPSRQHAWNEVLPQDDHGNVVPPRHHVLLLLELDRRGPPTQSDWDALGQALEGIEHAYQRGAEGLLVTAGYSPTYFERFDADLPTAVDLPDPEPLSPLEDPAFDTPDLLVHLASNYAQVVLGAETALTGETDRLNGVDQPDAAVTDVCSVIDRRTGFVGAGLPADHEGEVDRIDDDTVDPDSPLFMGFKSGFTKNQATEDRVTIDAGPFAGGTTQHLSKLTLNLDQWYNQDDRWQREAKMFCPHHADNDVVEGVGENLGDESRIDECGDTTETARQSGVVGHSQKTARAREDDQPVIIRRDFNTTGSGQAGLHFLSVQQSIVDFVDTREAMNGTDVARNSAVGRRNNNGILQYVTTDRRGNYLLPPRSLRVFPRPNPLSEDADEVRNATP